MSNCKELTVLFLLLFFSFCESHPTEVNHDLSAQDVTVCWTNPTFCWRALVQLSQASAKQKMDLHELTKNLKTSNEKIVELQENLTNSLENMSDKFQNMVETQEYYTKFLLEKIEKGEEMTARFQQQIQLIAVNGSWSLWTSWSSCKEETKQRNRTCTSPSPVHGGEECTGEYAEEEHCCEAGEHCCEAGWSSFSLQCYKLLRGKTSHAEYKSACEESGGQLASVHSREENDFIVSLLRSGPKAYFTYIGGKEGSCGSTPGGSCVWLDNTEWTWSNWNSDQPNGDSYLILGYASQPPAQWWDNAGVHKEDVDAVCKI